MINSPIRTVIKNNSSSPFISVVSSTVRIHLNAKGEPGDSIFLPGDVFTYIDRTPVAEALMGNILDGRIALEYSIDPIGTTTTSDEPNFRSGSSMISRLKGLFKGAKKGEKQTADTNAEQKKPQAPKADETSKQPEKPVETKGAETQKPMSMPEGPTEPVAESDKAPKIPEAPAEPKQPEKPAAKATKKQRQIKID